MIDFLLKLLLNCFIDIASIPADLFFPFLFFSLLLLFLFFIFKKRKSSIPVLVCEHILYTLFICSLLDRFVKFGHKPGKVIKIFVVG